MSLEAERDDWKRRALSAEGILAFVLLELGHAVEIKKSTVEAGFPENVEVFLDTSQEDILKVDIGQRTSDMIELEDNKGT